jgi:hypothetical protein
METTTPIPSRTSTSRRPTAAISAAAAFAAGVLPWSCAFAQPTAFDDPMTAGTIDPAWSEVCLYSCGGLVGGPTASGYTAADVIGGPASGLGDAMVWPSAAIVRPIAPTGPFTASAVLDWENTASGRGAYQRIFLEVVDAAGCVIACVGRSADLGDRNGDQTSCADLSFVPQCGGYQAAQNIQLNGGFFSPVTVYASRDGAGVVRLWASHPGWTTAFTPHTGTAPAAAVRISFWRWAMGSIGSLTVRDVHFRSTFCPADFDRSGALAVADIFSFLNSWFAGDPAADFDGVSGLQVSDIFAFLNAWFAGCS